MILTLQNASSAPFCPAGKVDMKAIEVTIQNLISSGLDPRLENNPYLCFVYTSFQVRIDLLIGLLSCCVAVGRSHWTSHNCRRVE